MIIYMRDVYFEKNHQEIKEIIKENVLKIRKGTERL